ncbi:hypothetical protein [Bradyrhizobium canariense]|uniref:hypothetical protein n=1 Tax=Bradyrhizobium canariense TaxID=255045 RepID=UPI001CA4FBCB|nr:hypothetical protein [Bradyrhizobium canariense]
MLFGNVIATLDASCFLRSVKGARIAPYVGDDLIAKLENPIVFQSFNAVANALDSGCKTSNAMPRHLGAGGINHDYNRARIMVAIGIAGDIPSDTGAVLASYFSRAKQFPHIVRLCLAFVENREVETSHKPRPSSLSRDHAHMSGRPAPVKNDRVSAPAALASDRPLP